jgi:hypothetical protein
MIKWYEWGMDEFGYILIVYIYLFIQVWCNFRLNNTTQILGIVEKEGKEIGTTSFRIEQEAEETKKEVVVGVEGEEDIDGVEKG